MIISISPKISVNADAIVSIEDVGTHRIVRLSDGAQYKTKIEASDLESYAAPIVPANKGFYAATIDTCPASDLVPITHPNREAVCAPGKRSAVVNLEPVIGWKILSDGFASPIVATTTREGDFYLMPDGRALSFDGLPVDVMRAVQSKIDEAEQ